MASADRILAATRQAFIAKYEIPITATLPLVHGRVPAHSTASKKSSASALDSNRGVPGDLPVPRVSQRITTYPSGTHHSGFTVSQCM